MAISTTTSEDRKRKTRNIVLSSLILLIILWTFKLSHPRYSIISSSTTDHNRTRPHKSISPSSSTKPKSPPQYGTTTPGGIMLATDPKSGFNKNIGDKAAVIIETRFRQNLIPLILHFSAVLGPSWPVLIYTSSEAVGMFSSSAALSRYLRAGTIQLRILPSTVLITDSESVSSFLTKSWLWDSLAGDEKGSQAGVEWVLMFQSDSMICANAARTVEEYFEYDFVGAPIASELGKGYGGGLSLRRRSSVLRVLGEWDWDETSKDGDRFEDQWFYNRLIELQQEEEAAGIQPTDDGAINLPSMEIARTFSVESIEYPHPLGVHQLTKLGQDQLSRLDEWCPEHRLCSGEKPSS